MPGQRLDLYSSYCFPVFREWTVHPYLEVFLSGPQSGEKKYFWKKKILGECLRFIKEMKGKTAGKGKETDSLQTPLQDWWGRESDVTIRSPSGTLWRPIPAPSPGTFWRGSCCSCIHLSYSLCPTGFLHSLIGTVPRGIPHKLCTQIWVSRPASLGSNQEDQLSPHCIFTVYHFNF